MKYKRLLYTCKLFLSTINLHVPYDRAITGAIFNARDVFDYAMQYHHAIRMLKFDSNLKILVSKTNTTTEK